MRNAALCGSLFYFFGNEVLNDFAKLCRHREKKIFQYVGVCVHWLGFLGKRQAHKPVSYTHLDVYKRQPFYLLLSISDATSDNEEKEKIADIFTAHIDCFIEKYATSKLQNNEDIQI